MILSLVGNASAGEYGSPYGSPAKALSGLGLMASPRPSPEVLAAQALYSTARLI